MKNSSNPKKIIILSWILAVISFLGLLDASYLTVEHFLGQVPDCTILHGCEIVTTSEWSVIFGIPVALMGAIFYLIVFIGSLLTVLKPRPIVILGLKLIGTGAFLFSLFLVYLMLFQINAICIYCMFSAGSSTLIFITSLFLKAPPVRLPEEEF